MEQELLKQILEGLIGIKEDLSVLKKDVGVLKKDVVKLDKKIDRVEKRLINEINLQGRYILEDVKRVSDKLNRVIEINDLVV